MPLKIIILAAGQGKRMHSSLPKILHPLGGKPLLQHVLDTANQLKPKEIYIIYGHGGEAVRQQFAHIPDIQWILQEERLGTGHAVKQALPLLEENDRILILSADVPLIAMTTLTRLIDDTPQQNLGLLVADFHHPHGLGRIIRNDEGYITGIIEQRDANETEQQIKEIYSGIMLITGSHLKTWVLELSNDNAQGEYYLTEIIQMAVEANVAINGIKARRAHEVSGVNNRAHLAMLERYYQMRRADQLMISGVTIIDPARFDLRGELIAKQDVVIDVNVIIEGCVTIGKNSVIGANCILRNAEIGEGVEIQPNSIIDDSSVGSGSVVGPYARLRPGTRVAENAKIGNFVEIKKTEIGMGSKVPHLSYIGDSIIGQNVNIGAGTITCNYDGVFKHQTIIEDGAFIGSDTQLVAPVTIGANATVGAGSTIRKNAPADELTISYSQQKTVPGWVRPKKRKGD